MVAALLLLLLLLLQVQDLQLRIQHEEQERLDLKRKADDKEVRAAQVCYSRQCYTKQVCMPPLPCACCLMDPPHAAASGAVCTECKCKAWLLLLLLLPLLLPLHTCCAGRYRPEEAAEGA
jgi:hypothetical protein